MTVEVADWGGGLRVGKGEWNKRGLGPESRSHPDFLWFPGEWAAHPPMAFSAQPGPQGALL